MVFDLPLSELAIFGPVARKFCFELAIFAPIANDNGLALAKFCGKSSSFPLTL